MCMSNFSFHDLFKFSVLFFLSLVLFCVRWYQLSKTIFIICSRHRFKSLFHRLVLQHAQSITFSVSDRARLSHSRSFSAPSKVERKLGARTVMIMNQAKQEVERREETKEEKSKGDTEKNAVQTKNQSGSLQSVGRVILRISKHQNEEMTCFFIF